MPHLDGDAARAAPTPMASLLSDDELRTKILAEEAKAEELTAKADACDDSMMKQKQSYLDLLVQSGKRQARLEEEQDRRSRKGRNSYVHV